MLQKLPGSGLKLFSMASQDPISYHWQFARENLWEVVGNDRE
jgi:hypothetical protein